MSEHGTQPPGGPAGQPGTTAVRLDQGHIERQLDVEGNTGIPERFTNPGFPPHVRRASDLDEQAARRAERQVAALFSISMLATITFLVAYFTIDQDAYRFVPGIGQANVSNVVLGVSLGLSLLCIGLGAVHWAKTLMSDTEIAEERAGSLGPLPENALSTTFWRKGMRLMRDPELTPILASDVTVGSVFHVLPEGIDKSEHVLEEKGKAAVLLMRLDPALITIAKERDWGHEGIIAYSKICTHVGCPVALYEQQTHHLLCPCHQSTFDVTQDCKVIFGPAHRPLPQLKITVDTEGYLMADSPFREAVGPSFWERG